MKADKLDVTDGFSAELSVRKSSREILRKHPDGQVELMNGATLKDVADAFEFEIRANAFMKTEIRGLREVLLLAASTLHISGQHPELRDRILAAMETKA